MFPHSHPDQQVGSRQNYRHGPPAKLPTLAAGKTTDMGSRKTTEMGSRKTTDTAVILPFLALA